MAKALGTQAHLVGYGSGLLATLAGLFGHNLSLSNGKSSIAIAAGLGTVALSVVTKLLADLGVSKATIAHDVAAAEKIIDQGKTLEPMIEKLPLYGELSGKVDKMLLQLQMTARNLASDTDVKVGKVKADIDAEIAKLPVADQQALQQAVADLFKNLNPLAAPPPAGTYPGTVVPA